MPHLILRGQSTGKGINLIPLITLTSQDVQTSLLNILLFIPFGLGLPFLIKLPIKKVVLIGALFSFLIEMLQLLTGVLANMTFRVADINDVIFNTIGVILGYLLFRGFTYLSRKKKKSAKSVNS